MSAKEPSAALKPRASTVLARLIYRRSCLKLTAEHQDTCIYMGSALYQSSDVLCSSESVFPIDLRQETEQVLKVGFVKNGEIEMLIIG